MSCANVDGKDDPAGPLTAPPPPPGLTRPPQAVVCRAHEVTSGSLALAAAAVTLGPLPRLVTQ